LSEIVDARGLSCPQPVLMALGRMKKMGAGRIDVLVDTETSMENCTRAATSQGWTMDGVWDEDGGFRLRISKE
jgi:TusA-related sulfurtransferase